MTTTMKAIVQETYGSADVLELRDVDQPTAGAGEVLLRVHAAGVSRGDVHLMHGEPYLVRAAVGLRRPRNRVPGRDVAGTVVAIGSDVTRFAVGDEVFGIARGSFAEYAVGREDKLAHKPSALTFAQAAAMPVSGLTALRALDAARVQAGQTVLVVGASGGVGTYAVQLAVASDATVTGVASAAKAQLVRELGAAHVIDYAHEDFADGSRTFDVVLDIGGVTPISRLRRALTRTGTLVIVGGENGATWSPGMGRQLHALLLNPFVSPRLTMVLNKEHFSGLERLAAYAVDGRLASFTDRPFELSATADAIRHLVAGKARGKVFITV
ncbi:MAG: NAD(P)-dependent alcohol dehydrogenase [Kineosporiaceae bacterium]